MKRNDRSISAEVFVSAPVKDVWLAWTTEDGARTFFAPDCRIDLRPGGAYEMYFNLEEEPGKRGGEAMILLAIQPEALLSFTWNAPPELPNVRGQMTHVSVRFTSEGEQTTRVTLDHDGWGRGGQWDEAFDYFVQAWDGVVLERLKYRFEERPVDWENPPAPGET